MGMSIDEALNYMSCLMEACSHCLVRGCDKPIEKIDEAKIVAIDTMCKYQKIERYMEKLEKNGQYGTLRKLKIVLGEAE